MSQRQQLERIIEIDRQIRGKQYPCADSLAKSLEVSRRVIFNDRTFLADRLGAPIAYSRTRGGWYYQNDTWVLPTAIITQAEFFSFFLCIEIARRQLGTVFEKELFAIVRKIGAGLTGAVAVDLESLRSHYTVSPPCSAATDEKTLLALHEAIRDRRRVYIEYFTASRRSKNSRKVDPHHLHNVAGDWYLIAYDHNRQVMLTFHAGRISALNILAEGFVSQPDFSATDWMRSSFRTERLATTIEIAVRFEAEQAVYIRERQWHPTQTIEELPDGSLVLRWRGGGLGEIKRWIMQYGAQAEVLEPAELRSQICDEIRKLTQKYGIASQNVD